MLCDQVQHWLWPAQLQGKRRAQIRLISTYACIGKQCAAALEHWPSLSCSQQQHFDLPPYRAATAAAAFTMLCLVLLL
jgi:hypothetical protein